MTALSPGITSTPTAPRRDIAPPTGLRPATAEWWIRPAATVLRRWPRAIKALRPLVLACGWRYSASMRANMLCNAGRVLGQSSTLRQRRALAKATFASCLDSIVEVAASPPRSDAELAGRLAGVTGLQGYQEARKARRGAILVTAHFGAFEIGMFALRQHEPKVHVVFRRDNLKAFDDLRRELRDRFGVMESPVDDGLPVWLSLRDALARDEVVLIQGDRTLPGQRGFAVPFMGGHLLMPTGPAKLALASGAPIIPIFAPREADGRVRISLHLPIFVNHDDPIEPTMRTLAAAIESEVRAYPEQWLVIHRAWCEDSQERSSAELLT